MELSKGTGDFPRHDIINDVISRQDHYLRAGSREITFMFPQYQIAHDLLYAAIVIETRWYIGVQRRAAKDRYDNTGCFIRTDLAMIWI